MKRIILILALAPLVSLGQDPGSWMYKKGHELFTNPVNLSKIDGKFNYLHHRDTFSYEINWFSYAVKPGKQFGISALVKYNSLGETYQGFDYNMFEILMGLAWFPWKENRDIQVANTFLVGFNTYASKIISIDTVGYFEIETTSREVKSLFSATMRVMSSAAIHEKFFIQHTHDIQVFFLSDHTADHWFLTRATYRKKGLEAGVLYEHRKGGGVTLGYRIPVLKYHGIKIGTNIMFWDSVIPNVIQAQLSVSIL